MTTIQSILDQYGIPYRSAGEHHHVTSRFVGVDCPFCSRDSGKFRLGLSLDNAFGVCWTCGYHRLGDILAEITREPLSVVLPLIDGLSGSRRGAVRAVSGKNRVKLPSSLEALRTPHRRYLRQRGFDPDHIAQLWGVKGIGLAARLSWRIWIPIHLQGELVSWTTRSISETPPDSQRRYVNAPSDEEAVPAASLLYGEDFVRHSIIVVEGPTDAWRIGPGAVATMGVSYTQSQLLRIGRYPLRTVIFDRNREAQKQAGKLVRALEPFPGETYLVEMETGKDVGDADPGEIDTIRETFLGKGECHA